MGKRGPTPKGEFTDKSAVLSTRISNELRAELEAAVEDSGLTLSREIELRLRKSFVEEKSIAEMFGDQSTFALMLMIAGAIQLSVKKKGAGWLQNPNQFEIAIGAALNVLEAIRPEGELDVSIAERHLHTQGQKAAFQIWRAVKRADPTIPLKGGSLDDRRNARLKMDLKGLADIALEDGAWAKPGKDQA
jgi:hypothetical protein